MLIHLLRTHLRPHRNWLVLVRVFQTVQAFASLLLPNLNDDTL